MKNVYNLLLIQLFFTNFVHAGILKCPDKAQEVGGTPPKSHVLMCVKEDGTRHGPFLIYDKAGKKKRAGAYNNDVLEGSYVEWHKNGTEAVRGTFKNGKMQGVWVRFHENGTKQDEGEWNQSEPVGKWTQWHDNGKVYAAGTFSEAEKNCDWSYFDESGKVVKREYSKCAQTTNVSQAINKSAPSQLQNIQLNAFTFSSAYVYPQKMDQHLSAEFQWSPWLKLKNAPYGLGFQLGVLPTLETSKSYVRVIGDFQVQAMYMKNNFFLGMGPGALYWQTKGSYPSANVSMTFKRMITLSYTGFMYDFANKYSTHIVRVGFLFGSRNYDE